MTTAKDSKRASPEDAFPRNAQPARARKPTVRKRCNPRESGTTSIEAEVAAAMPQIVRATVRKAKQGSLTHTKWLWGVVEKVPKASAIRTTLGELLQEQLKNSGIEP